MNAEPDDIRLIRLHKRWADRWTVLSMFFIVLLFGGIYAVFEEIHADPSARTDSLILLAVIVLTAMIWQSIGLGIARVHMLIKGIDLEQQDESRRRRRE